MGKLKRALPEDFSLLDDNAIPEDVYLQKALEDAERLLEAHGYAVIPESSWQKFELWDEHDCKLSPDSGCPHPSHGEDIYG